VQRINPRRTSGDLYIFTDLVLFCFFLFCNRGDTKYHGGLRSRELCQAPISWMQALSSHPHPSWLWVWLDRRKANFLNFANAKVAATGFEPETRGDRSSLSDPRVLPIAPPRPTFSQILWRCNRSKLYT
jgi:hypothetical protein